MRKTNYFFNFIRSYHRIFLKVLFFEIFYSIRFREFIPKIKVQNNSKYFHSELNKIKNTFPKIIKEIRGRGFLIGIQLYKDQSNFIKDLMKNKLLTIRAAENVVRILPPLNVKKNEINQALKIIKKVCSQY